MRKAFLTLTFAAALFLAGSGNLLAVTPGFERSTPVQMKTSRSLNLYFQGGNFGFSFNYQRGFPGYYNPGYRYYNPGYRYYNPGYRYYNPGYRYYNPGYRYYNPGYRYYNPGYRYYNPGYRYYNPGYRYYNPGYRYYNPGPVFPPFW